MSKEEILTEYFENMTQPGEEGDVVVLDVPEEPVQHEVVEVVPQPVAEAPSEAFIVSFSEDDFEEEELPPFEEVSFEEPMGDEDLNLGEAEEISFEEDLGDLGGEFSEEIKELQDELVGDESEEVTGEAPAGSFLPGATEPILDEAEPEEEEEEVETNWVDDRDTSKFIDYLRDSFASIPQHSGNSISGCERALTYLNKLNREISEAVRKDDKNALDEVLDEVEEFRVKILKGMVALKNRIGELKKKFKEEGSQKIANETADLIKESLESEEGITKEAKSGKLQVVITPFERAVTGILINSVVSAGHPFEEVYDYLKKKFSLTEREELAILQIVMDMGFPVFKDRGTIGGKGDGEQEGHHVDFIKNYFG